MRVTRESMIRIAKETVQQRLYNDRAIVAAYLTGALVQDDVEPILGGTADIDIIFTTIIFFHVSVNLGMAVGLLPVTGLPLPFISYGGSSLVTNMIMIGIMLNFYRNRFEY